MSQSPLTIAQPENLQLQSALVYLPAEIKHIIYSYSFTADKPIVDAVVGCPRATLERIPALGVNLLGTCRRVYHEADRRPLFARNTFRFTHIDGVRTFLKVLGEGLKESVQDIEVDARRVHADHPGIGSQWLHYLACGGGSWTTVFRSLHDEAPKLKCLRLDLTSWPNTPMFYTEYWSLLRNTLIQLAGLERIALIGATKGDLTDGREPWWLGHFVGRGDVEYGHLVEQMCRAVGDDNDSTKVIRWTRANGRLELEVVSKAYLVKEVDRCWAGPCLGLNHRDQLPEHGSCTWPVYQSRKSSGPEGMVRTINPSAAG